MSPRVKFLIAVMGMGLCLSVFTGSHGYSAPLSAGNEKDKALAVSLVQSSDRVVLEAKCIANQEPEPECTPTTAAVQFSAVAGDPDRRRLKYRFFAPGARITTDGPNATVDFTGADVGTYMIGAEVRDDKDKAAFSQKTVVVSRCACRELQRPQCATVTTSCPGHVTEGDQATVTAKVSGGNPNRTYNWTVSEDVPFTGQGTPEIHIDTSRKGGTTITATVDIGGASPGCNSTSSCSVTVDKP